LILDITVARNYELVEWILKKNYKTVIPANVMNRLELDKQGADPKTSSAHIIVESIKTAARNQKDVRIFDIDQGDVTKEAIQVKDAGQWKPEDDNEDVSITLGVARRATDELVLSKKESTLAAGEFDYTDGHADAVLLTDSENMQQNAQRQNILSVLGGWFRQRVINKV
jgi:hypothetical protein